MPDIKSEFTGREVELPQISVEVEKLPELATEKSTEQTENKIITTPVPEPSLTAPVEQVEDKLPISSVIQQNIEKVLEEDLAAIYQDLPQDKQLQFKAKGEETAVKINILLQAVKIKLQDIIRLILDWLGFLPNINRHFIEQEAKIKADKILKLKK